jgi:transcriptional regulator with XRE-family HTH domain
MSPRVVPSGIPDGPGDLARKLNELIRLKRRPDGDEYTQAEIADGASELCVRDQIQKETALRASGASQKDIDSAIEEIRNGAALMNRTYVGKLLNGTRDNPSMDVLWYLAQWFGVPVAYFFPGEEGEAVQREVALLAALQTLRDADQLEDLGVLLRSTEGLSPSAAKNVLRVAIVTAHAAREIHDDAVSGDG